MQININSITNSKIHQNCLEYWFTFWHVAMDDPVIGGDKKGWNAHFKGPTKGQIKLKAYWRTVDSSKRRTNKFGGFFCRKKQEIKKQTNLFVLLLGESTARKSAYGFIWPLKKHWLRIRLRHYLLRLIHLNVKWKRHHNLLYNFYWHLWYWNGCTYTIQCHLYNKKEA